MSTSPNILLKEVAQIRTDLEQSTKSRRQAQIKQAKELEEQALRFGLMPAVFTLAPDIAYLISTLTQRAQEHIQQFQAPPTPHVPSPPPALGGSTQEILNSLQCLMALQIPPSSAEQFLAKRLQEYLESTTQTQAQNRQAGNTNILKLRQIQQALESQRLNDARTLLKNLLQVDPHNQHTSYLLSQLEYLLSSQGQQGALPEARDQAQRCMATSDRLQPPQQWRYRYDCIAAELPHSPERALEWLRSSELLNTELMLNEDGLFSGQGYLLMGWVLLSFIPANLWQETELEAMLTLVQQVPGGALIYLSCLRPPLLKQMSEGKATQPQVIALENQLQTSWLLHQNIHTAANNLANQTYNTPWLVKLRYSQSFLSAMPLPTFDQTLPHFSLASQQWLQTYPDQDFQGLMGERHLHYWKIWAYALTSRRESRQTQLLPFAEVQADAERITTFESMLNSLSQLEQERIRPDIWADLQPFLTRWTMDHLLTVGTGTSQPRKRFIPPTAPFNSLYDIWSHQSANAVLASDIIRTTAQHGGFGSWAEVLAAFDGAARLLDDPHYGLARNQKNALIMAKQQNPSQFGGISTAENNLNSTITLSIAILIFMGGMGAAFTMATNMGQTMGILLCTLGISGLVAFRSLSPE